MLNTRTHILPFWFMMEVCLKYCSSYVLVSCQLMWPGYFEGDLFIVKVVGGFQIDGGTDFFKPCPWTFLSQHFQDMICRSHCRKSFWVNSYGTIRNMRNTLYIAYRDWRRVNIVWTHLVSNLLENYLVRSWRNWNAIIEFNLRESGSL